MDSAKLIGAGGRNPFASLEGSGQYDWEYRRRDAEAWAEHYGVPFREPRGRLELDPDLLSRACALAKRLGAGEPYARSLFAAVFAEDVERVDRARCVELAARAGLDRAGFAAARDGGEARAEQEGILRRAVRRGAFGVPTFVAGDRLFWGNDRLVLLRRHLRNLP